MQGWVGSYRDGVGHAGVGWVIQGWGGSCWGGVLWEWGEACSGGVGHAGVGSGGLYRGRMGWVMKNIKILKNYWCYRVSNPAN